MPGQNPLAYGRYVPKHGPTFLTRLRSALEVSDSAPLVFLGNFEVERHWGAGEPGLPTLSLPASDLVVNRMDEFSLTLAGPEDFVILKQRPDPDYLEYLTSLGWRPPHVVVPVDCDPARDVTGDALADELLLNQLAGLQERNALIFAHGVSAREEELARACGLPLATPSAVVCKAVNSKVYSRRLAERLGLRQPQGWWCDGLDRWRSAMAWAREVVGSGGLIVVKDAFGVSGKGILKVDTEKRLDRLDRLFSQRADRRGDNRLAVVVEEWVAKSADLNYQFTLARDKTVSLDFVKEALTEDGVHRGHLISARLRDETREQITEASLRIGEELAADGYFGVVGVDAMIDPDGGLYPVTEINARNNMSTYQESLLELVGGAGRTVLARHYPVMRNARSPFTALRAALGDTLLTEKRDDGLVVNNFATVGAGQGADVPGRLYGLVFGRDIEAVNAIDGRIVDMLENWEKDGMT